MRKKLTILGALVVLTNAVSAKEVLPVVEIIEEAQVETVAIQEQNDDSIPVEVEIPKVANLNAYKEGENIYNIYGRVGGDVYSKYDKFKEMGKSINKEKTGTMGYEVGLEGTIEVMKDLEMGLGIAYQNHGKVKSKSHSILGGDGNTKTINMKLASFDSVPIYGVAKYNFKIGETDIKPYLKANLGYSFNFKKGESKDSIGTKMDSKVSNGLYYGVGLGVEYKNLFIDLMYQINESKLAVKDMKKEIKEDYDYSRVTLGFGYKFNF